MKFTSNIVKKPRDRSMAKPVPTPPRMPTVTPKSPVKPVVKTAKLPPIKVTMPTFAKPSVDKKKTVTGARKQGTR